MLKENAESVLKKKGQAAPLTVWQASTNRGLSYQTFVYYAACDLGVAGLAHPFAVALDHSHPDARLARPTLSFFSG